MRLMPVAIAALIVASSVSAPAVANGDQLVANICDYVKSDDKNRLRKKLKESRVKLPICAECPELQVGDE